VSSTEDHFKTSKNKLASGGVSVRDVVDVDAEVERRLREGFKVTLFYVYPEKLREQLNKSPRLEELRRSLQKDPKNRIVVAVAKVYDDDFVRKTSGRLTTKVISLKKWLNDEEIEFVASGDVTVKRKRSDGTIIGYRFARLCWDPEDGSVADLTEDRPLWLWWSDAGDCPPRSVSKWTAQGGR